MRNAITGGIGIAVVAIHVILFVLLVPTCRRAELSLEISDRLIVGDEPAGTIPEDIADRVHRDVVGNLDQPGLRHARYTVDYRGGFERSVGVTALVGPFQDPTKPACTGRVVVGQRLLDDGAAGPGTIAGEISRTLAAEMKGESIVGAGDFEKVAEVSLRWAQLAGHPDDWAMVREAPDGYVRATARLAFERLDVPVVVALIPQVTRDQLKFRIAARAELAFGNRAVQWISDRLGGDKLATRLARREIDAALITALAPPPPFELPGGQRLTFGYCDGHPEIIDGYSGALPFSITIGRVDRDPRILPPRRGPAVHAPITHGTVAIDLDLDALDALLYELWRTGFLDHQLAAAGLARRFNSDPIVAEFLTLRISSPVLALPPTIGIDDRGALAMYTDARVTIADGDLRTTGRIWSGFDFDFHDLARNHARPTSDSGDVGVDLSELELTCERSHTELVPCYADLVAAIRDRGGDFHDELTRTFTKLLSDIFLEQRVGASELSADLVIHAVKPAVYMVRGDNASLHLELDGVLDSKP